METVPVQLDRAKARDLYHRYKKHAHWSKPIDDEIQRAYQLLSQGKLVIRALEAVKLAGVKIAGVDAGFPKLAICRADAISCHCKIEDDGRAMMHPDNFSPRSRRRWGNDYHQSNSCIQWPRGSFARVSRSWRATALVPTPPLHLRPKRGLANYHVLWEAEWSKVLPNDPYLLRRIGRADLWLVCAQWDLTDVEKGALSTRLIS